MSQLPATFEQRVRERITETIADLIPPEELAKQVEAQVAHFKQQYLPKLIEQSIREQFAEAIRAEFAKPEYQPTWTSAGSMGASQAVKKLITDNGGDLLAGMIGSMVQQTIYSLQQQAARF